MRVLGFAIGLLLLVMTLVLGVNAKSGSDAFKAATLALAGLGFLALTLQRHRTKVVGEEIHRVTLGRTGLPLSKALGADWLQMEGAFEAEWRKSGEADGIAWIRGEGPRRVRMLFYKREARLLRIYLADGVVKDVILEPIPA